MNREQIEDWLLHGDGVKITMTLVPERDRGYFAYEMSKHIAKLVAPEPAKKRSKLSIRLYMLRRKLRRLV